MCSFFFSSRRRHTSFSRDWSSDVCSSDLTSGTRERLGLAPRRYGVVTLHRPSNVDEEMPLRQLVSELSGVASQLPLVFPVHPRTHQRLIAFGLAQELSNARGMQLVEPMGYIEFMGLVSE